MPSRASLVIEVRLMSQPCMWCWEIRDVMRDEIVESSWTHAWMAYESRDDALAAGHARRVDLARRTHVPRAS